MVLDYAGLPARQMHVLLSVFVLSEKTKEAATSLLAAVCKTISVTFCCLITFDTALIMRI